ncbi:MAG: PorT family protein [Prevotella sp.]|nr:PorT family protein [Prevotella sp.]MBO6187040.1 PorT family protein [Prevotella sp.]MBQ9636841.1 PorT family protein [Prevotella sp.]
MRKLLLLMLLIPAALHAQVGEYRTDLAIGVNGGYALSNVSFVPEIPQTLKGGLTGGLTIRYTCEKYFSSICAITAEVNVAQMGWQEKILDINDQPVINDETGVAEEYSRRITYIQVPLLARLGWGRERKGLQAFFQIGPQLGYYLNESTEANFDLDHPNVWDRASNVSGPDVDGHAFSNMYHMPVEKKFDYGITGGAGIEFSHPKIGHLLLEARYYYGLGNIYGNTKRDYFARSNNSSIIFKMTYLFDIVRTKNDKIK